MRKPVHTDKAPKPIGPYSQAILDNGFVFVSGQGAINPATGQLERGDARSETKRVFENLKTILEASGSSLAKVVKCNVYLADRTDFAQMNEVYKEFFTTDPPARTTVESHPPVDIRVEIDCVAYLPRGA
jgi:2-iminobutanoate/2-iminopropanoate deaminase